MPNKSIHDKHKIDIIMYKENYIQILGNIPEKMLFDHYNRIGKLKKWTDKNRIYELYPDFNYINYREKYDELKSLSKEEVERHWMLTGRHNEYSYERSIDISDIDFKINFEPELITDKYIIIGNNYDYFFDCQFIEQNNINNFIFINCIIVFNTTFFEPNLKTNNVVILDTKNFTSFENFNSFNNYDGIIVNNDYIKNLLIEKYKYNGIIHILYNPINILPSVDYLIKPIKIGVYKSDLKILSNFTFLQNIFHFTYFNDLTKAKNFNIIIILDDLDYFFSNNNLTNLITSSLLLIKKTITNLNILGIEYEYFIDIKNINSIILKLTKAINDIITNNIPKIDFNKILLQTIEREYFNFEKLLENKKTDESKKTLLIISIFDNFSNFTRFKMNLDFLSQKYSLQCIIIDNYTNFSKTIKLFSMDNHYIYVKNFRDNFGECLNRGLSFLKNEELILFLSPNSSKEINNEIQLNENFLFIESFLLEKLKLYDKIYFNEIFKNKYYCLKDFCDRAQTIFPEINFRKIIQKTVDFNIRDEMLFASINNKQLLENNNYINYENLNKLKELNLDCEFPSIIPKDFLTKLYSILGSNTKNKPILLTIGRSLYPANGGGENWLIDIMRFLENEYFCIGICFKDILNNIDFSEINLIQAFNIPIIQMSYDKRKLIEIIKKINPKVISHQGHLRLELCKISRLLKIPFITGFCFWNDLFLMEDFTNIQMETKQFIEDPNFKLIRKNSICYLASDFMKKIIEQNIENTSLEVLPTISHNSHYFTDKKKERKFICFMNAHYLKGGQELLYLLNNLDINIPILGIITEKSYLDNEIIKAFKNRNRKKNINILYLDKLSTVTTILAECKVLLIPSIVDETYCRVAYEGLSLGLPIISYRTGNIEHLLKDYKNNTFIELPTNIISSKFKIDNSTLSKWKQITETIYNSPFSQNELYDKIIIYEEHITSKIKQIINKKIENFQCDTIGIFCPFVDQGLGIQSREYILMLNKLGYKTAIFSHKPYLAKQINKLEWENLTNVYYSLNMREEITFDEVLNWVFDNKISTLIIPEICYEFIYSKIDYFKCLNIKIIAVINIETLRYNEIKFYNCFDIICTNNYSSYHILKNILPNNNVQLLEFDNLFLPKLQLVREIKPNIPIIFSTFGGLNSFSRKNIDKTYCVFKRLESELTNFILKIYIQDTKIVNNKIDIQSSNNIKLILRENSYFENINFLKESDIIIHLGDHEGLGLGLYEALNNNKAVITLDTFPNNELVIHEKNGWIIKNSFEPLFDNEYGIINRAIINNLEYYKTVKQILNSDYLPKLNNILMSKKIIKNNYKNNFQLIL